MASAPRLGRGINNNAFSPNFDVLAQLSGSGAPSPTNISPTFAATMALDSQVLTSAGVNILASHTTSATVTFTTATVCPPLALLMVIMTTDGTGTVTATFSTGFKVTATLAGTSTTRSVVLFVSDGTYWIEIGRNTAQA